MSLFLRPSAAQQAISRKYHTQRIIELWRFPSIIPSRPIKCERRPTIWTIDCKKRCERTQYSAHAPTGYSATLIRTTALRPVCDENSMEWFDWSRLGLDNRRRGTEESLQPTLKPRQNRLTGSKSMRITAVIHNGRSSHPRPQVVWCCMFYLR